MTTRERILDSHFKSKEEILTVLMDHVEDYYNANFGSETNLGEIPSSVDELITTSLSRIEFTLHDEKIRKTRRILAMEQFRSNRIAKLATKHSMESVQKLYQKIFEEMMDAGVLEKQDAKMLSVAFTSPITLLIQMCDREPERESEAMELMREYMTFSLKKELLLSKQ